MNYSGSQKRSQTNDRTDPFSGGATTTNMQSKHSITSERNSESRSTV